MYQIMLFGIYSGLIIFIFTFIASKKTGRFYLAPLTTFFAAVAVTVYGFTVVGGFGGMGYGFLGLSILSVAVGGTLILKLLVRKVDKKRLNKIDKGSLVVLPIILLTSIALIIYLEDNYWIIEKGETPFVEDETMAKNYYRVSTISEGSKQIFLSLNNEYLGKEIEVEKVSKWGATEITVQIVDGDNQNHRPYIMIGVDEIIEPLKVQTTDGVIFDSN
ncbi:hypothetical protein [Salipaludibacillus sp. CF4.18]|uniref:hypothetical protein n=1 Tax=Salipaludibacillus sp. CF4.18 TaxID=3373081 RepID=UPI003EE5197D